MGREYSIQHCVLPPVGLLGHLVLIFTLLKSIQNEGDAWLQNSNTWVFWEAEPAKHRFG